MISAVPQWNSCTISGFLKSRTPSFQPDVDVGAVKFSLEAGIGREPAREIDGLVADIDPGYALGAELLDAEGILAGVALKVEYGLAGKFAEQADLFREELVPALSQEFGLVGLVAVVRPGGLVPGAAVLLVERAARL